MLKESAIHSFEQGLLVENAPFYFSTSQFGQVGTVSYHISDDITILRQFGAEIVSRWKPGSLIIDLGAG